MVYLNFCIFPWQIWIQGHIWLYITHIFWCNTKVLLIIKLYINIRQKTFLVLHTHILLPLKYPS